MAATVPSHWVGTIVHDGMVYAESTHIQAENFDYWAGLGMAWGLTITVPISILGFVWGAWLIVRAIVRGFAARKL